MNVKFKKIVSLILMLMVIFLIGYFIYTAKVIGL